MPCAPGSVLDLPLTETSPGVYETWWSVPPDLPPGVYDLVGQLTIAGMPKAVTPPAVLIVLGPPAPPAPPAPPSPPPPAAVPPGAAAPPAAPPAPPPSPVPPTAAGPPGIPAGQAAPNGASWVTADDYLVLQVSSSLAYTIRITYRLLTPDGQIAYGVQNVTTAGGYLDQVFTMPLGPGYLLSAQVTPLGTGADPAMGQVFGSLYVGRGPTAAILMTWLLCSGYIGNNESIGWPAGRPMRSTEGQGLFNIYPVTTPAAGHDWSISVNQDARWRLVGIGGDLTTSAQAGNRAPVPQIILGTTTAMVVPSSLTQGPGTIIGWKWLPAYATIGQNAGSFNAASLPQPILLQGLSTVKCNTVAIQSSDQWSNVFVMVEEWLSPAEANA